MRVLVIGQGGREHALVKSMQLSPSVSEIHAVPGNPGMTEAIRHSVDVSDQESMRALCRKFQYDLVVIGPEQPLVDGLADALRQDGLNVFGPEQKAAQLEGSKVFCKEFLQGAGIPTARAVIVTSVEEALSQMPSFTPPYVLKVDGLAAGKGVFICASQEELKTAAVKVFDEKIFGISGHKALLEQFQPGYELSYFVLMDGEHYASLPVAQDHKRIGEGETGPNTGGMGAVAPLQLPTKLNEQIKELVVEPTVKHFRTLGMDYKGVLFVGLMITDSGPSVLEYNVRFGDPETQVLLPLLDGDWGQTLLDVAQGQLKPLKWKSLMSSCVVLAAPGYPDNAQKGAAIEGDPFTQTSSSYFLHSGVGKSEGSWVVNGGRVLNAIGLGEDLKEALEKSYSLAGQVSWAGLQMRTDIGKKTPQY